MDLKEIGVNMGIWADSVQDWDYWESPCEYGIAPPGSISHGVKNRYIYNKTCVLIKYILLQNIN